MCTMVCVMVFLNDMIGFTTALHYFARRFVVGHSRVFRFTSVSLLYQFRLTRFQIFHLHGVYFRKGFYLSYVFVRFGRQSRRLL